MLDDGKVLWWTMTADTDRHAVPLLGLSPASPVYRTVVQRAGVAKGYQARQRRVVNFWPEPHGCSVNRS